MNREDIVSEHRKNLYPNLNLHNDCSVVCCDNIFKCAWTRDISNIVTLNQSANARRDFVDYFVGTMIFGYTRRKNLISTNLKGARTLSHLVLIRQNSTTSQEHSRSSQKFYSEAQISRRMTRIISELRIEAT